MTFFQFLNHEIKYNLGMIIRQIGSTDFFLFLSKNCSNNII